MTRRLGLSVGRRYNRKQLPFPQGKIIRSLSVDDHELRIVFTDGTGVRIFDDGYSCCEHRYMNCDDDLAAFAGAEFFNAELREGPNIEDGEYGDVKECEFLVVTTSTGSFTVASYNEHNGYYGGFSITAEEFEA